MSFLYDALTVVGLPVDLPFRLLGKVGPVENALIQDEAGRANAKALGPNATEEERERAYNAAADEIAGFLRSTNAHPEQALTSPSFGWFGEAPEPLLKNAERLLKIAVAGGVIVGGLYFGAKFLSIAREFWRK